MTTDATAAQVEPRNDKVAIAVTKAEKDAVRVVAALRGTDESNLCRTTSIEEIVAEFHRIRARTSEPEPAETGATP